MPLHEPQKALLRDLFGVAVQVVKPCAVLPAYLPPLEGYRHTVLIAAGKAAAEMAKVTLTHYGRPLPGIVVTRYGHGLPDQGHVRFPDCITYVEASHPVPDAAGMAVARQIIEMAKGLGAKDHVLMLLSGGASSLLALPTPGLSLRAKQEVTKALLSSGASIGEINCVRKHLSAIKGGRLALAAAPATITNLLISDVVGDDPALIASGPTVPDPTTLGSARDILAAYNIALPAEVKAALMDAKNETPKPDAHAAFSANTCRVIASASTALIAAAQAAEAAGYEVVFLGDDIEGDAAQAGTEHAGIALKYRRRDGRFALISGGECTVVLKNKQGRGGPNGEYLLSLALALEGTDGIHAIACDTDGIDGSEDNAGAVIDPSTLARAAVLGLDLAEHLRCNTSYEAFLALDDLVITGPSRTNVNDFRAILIDS